MPAIRNVNHQRVTVTGDVTDDKTQLHGVLLEPGANVAIKDNATLLFNLLAPATESRMHDLPGSIRINEKLTVTVSAGACVVFYGYA